MLSCLALHTLCFHSPELHTYPRSPQPDKIVHSNRLLRFDPPAQIFHIWGSGLPDGRAQEDLGPVRRRHFSRGGVPACRCRLPAFAGVLPGINVVLDRSLISRLRVAPFLFLGALHARRNAIIMPSSGHFCQGLRWCGLLMRRSVRRIAAASRRGRKTPPAWWFGMETTFLVG